MKVKIFDPRQNLWLLAKESQATWTHLMKLAKWFEVEDAIQMMDGWFYMDNCVASFPDGSLCTLRYLNGCR